MLLRNVADGTLRRTLTGSFGLPVGVAFSPDGTRLAAGDNDGRVRLWDVRTGNLLLTMIGLGKPDGRDPSREWVAWTPEGRYDWSPGAESVIRWRLNGKLYPASAFKELRREGLLRD